MLSWVKSEDFGDTDVFSSDGKKFRAHRDILTRRSETFASLMTPAGEGAKGFRLDILAFNATVVESLLIFAYTDAALNASMELLNAAIFYKYDRLESLCIAELVKKINVESVVDNIQLAERKKIGWLKTASITFLTEFTGDLPYAQLLRLIPEFPHLSELYAEVFQGRERNCVQSQVVSH